jgi:hypothetical protein
VSDARNTISGVFSICVLPTALVGDAFGIVSTLTIGNSRVFVDVFNFTVAVGPVAMTPTTTASITSVRGEDINKLFFSFELAFMNKPPGCFFTSSKNFPEQVSLFSARSAVPSGGSVVYLVKARPVGPGWFTLTITTAIARNYLKSIDKFCNTECISSESSRLSNISVVKV